MLAERPLPHMKRLPKMRYHELGQIIYFSFISQSTFLTKKKKKKLVKSREGNKQQWNLTSPVNSHKGMRVKQ